jgi:hypothetical protein
MNHPPYSPDSAPSNFNLLGPMKVHLEDKNFKLMMNLNVVSWTGYVGRIKPFMQLPSVTPQNGKKNTFS